jgi:hypothetical protein
MPAGTATTAASGALVFTEADDGSRYISDADNRRYALIQDR